MKVMTPFRKTPVAVKELNTTYFKLIGLIRFGKIAPRQRDSSSHYIWTDDDLARAREALKIDLRRRKAVTT